MLNNPNVPFANIVMYVQPYLALRTVAGTIMTIGHIAFTTLFVINIAGWGRHRSSGPTLFSQPPLPVSSPWPSTTNIIGTPSTHL
jgi:cytochrome c oxidase cbb3-type subunit 1